jgi:hypothetical protein
MENVYQENGYKNRYDYLVCLSEEYGVDKGTVFTIASMLGENEDFDGLVSQLNDMEGF